MKIKYKDLFLMLALIPYFRPFSLAYLQGMGIEIARYIFSGLYLFSYTYTIYLIIKKNKVSIVVILIGLLFLWMQITTLMQNGLNVDNNFVFYFRYFAFLFIVDVEIRKSNKVLKYLFYLFEVSIYLNFLSMLLHPSGMYLTTMGATLNYYGGTTGGNWLIGGKNTLIRYILPAIGIALAYSYINNNSKQQFRAVLLIMCSVITAFISNSGTAIIIMAIGIALVLYIMVNGTKLFPLYLFAIIPIVIFVVVVVLNRYSFANNFINNIMGKERTFGIRTEIWASTVLSILSKPLLGHGFSSNAEYARVFLGYYHPHDYYLYILYIGGIVGLALLISVFVVCLKKIKRTQYYQFVGYIAIIILLIMTQMVFDTIIEANFYYLMFVVAYNIENIIRLAANKNRKLFRFPFIKKGALPFFRQTASRR